MRVQRYGSPTAGDGRLASTNVHRDATASAGRQAALFTISAHGATGNATARLQGPWRTVASRRWPSNQSQSDKWQGYCTITNSPSELSGERRPIAANLKRRKYAAYAPSRASSRADERHLDLPTAPRSISSSRKSKRRWPECRAAPVHEDGAGERAFQRSAAWFVDQPSIALGCKFTILIGILSESYVERTD